MIRSKKTAIFVLLYCAMITVICAQDAKTMVLQHMNTDTLSLNTKDLLIIQDVVSKTSGVRHIKFQQTLEGVPILHTESSIHINKKGHVIKINDYFVPNAKGLSSSAQKNILAPEQAFYDVIKDLGYSDGLAFRRLKETVSRTDEVRFSNGGVFERDVSLFMKYAPWEGRLIPIWLVEVFDRDYSHYWEVWYHATEGRVLKKNDLVVHCEYGSSETIVNYNDNLFDIPHYKEEETLAAKFCQNCYEVFALPVESPLHGNRSLAEEPHNTNASPYGWHDFDGEDGHDTEVTDGNNVQAFEAGDKYGYQPAGGDQLDFSGFPFSIFYSELSQYEDASITNAFYVCNSAHDIFYAYGFDEASGNFQFNNYGNGGLEKDPLEVQVQNITRPCNASMVSAARDGIAPTMLLNTCNTRDGGFDNLVILHEYAHGLTTRMTLGDGNLIYEESPTEGWSDWYGLMLTMQESHTALTPRTIGTYLREQSPSGSGVRRYPYIIDTTRNPYDFGSLHEEMRIHEVGTVWATILWELTWRLIDEFGFDTDVRNFQGDFNQDAGNIMALAIVTEGLRFTSKFSGFVGARDGILAAAESIYGPGILCLVWEAFTVRGLGVHAESGNKLRVGDEVASYDFTAIQPGFDLSLIDLCESSEKLNGLSGGFPRGGVYSGPGVRDNGNGVNFSFDPSLAGPGTHEIVYTMPETPCFGAFELPVEVFVGADNEPPNIQCVGDQTVKYTSPLGYELINFIDDLHVDDACSGTSLKSSKQTPVPGTMLVEGTVDITLEVEDPAGNTSMCTFLLTLKKVADLNGNDLGVAPIPAAEQFNLENPSEFLIHGYEIWDLAGKRIYENQLGVTSTSIPISITYLPQGMYFLKVHYNGTTLVLKIIKE